jgi:hypothetical protein
MEAQKLQSNSPLPSQSTNLQIQQPSVHHHHQSITITTMTPCLFMQSQNHFTNPCPLLYITATTMKPHRQPKHHHLQISQITEPIPKPIHRCISTTISSSIQPVNCPITDPPRLYPCSSAALKVSLEPRPPLLPPFFAVAAQICSPAPALLPPRLPVAPLRRNAKPSRPPSLHRTQGRVLLSFFPAMKERRYGKKKNDGG